MGIKRKAAIILAAGQGTRMKSAKPKVLHPIAGRPMIGHVLAALAPIGCDPVIIVTAPGMEAVERYVAPHPTAIQATPLGTGHAVAAARSALGEIDGLVLVLFGDTPFVSPATLARMIARADEGDRPSLVILGFRPADPTGYGRLVLDGAGRLARIVEHKDASAAERAIGLCNSGVMAIAGDKLWPWIARIGNANAKSEYYLTDIVGLASASGETLAIVEAPEEELLGINSRAELAAAEAIFQNRRRAQALAEGASLVDPGSVFFAADTILGRDVTIGPHVVFGPGVVIADHVEIRAFSHIEGAKIGANAIIGPFARLRPGAEIGAGAHIGNFVEAKNARIGPGAKANHLSYLGDAEIGAGANIGAGTITCNYDGILKATTRIGAGAFIGSNSALVAPVAIGEGAIIGAGSVITRDVAADAIAVARAAQVERPESAGKFRAARAERKRRAEAKEKGKG